MTRAGGAPGDLARLNDATAGLEPPFAVVGTAALRANAADMVRRAAGKPIRVASKSVRCRALTERVLALGGFRGIMAFTPPEALWLARSGQRRHPGELCERFTELHLIEGAAVTGTVPTYRGEGKSFA